MNCGRLPLANLRLTVDDLERHGPGPLLDCRGPRGKLALVRTDRLRRPSLSARRAHHQRPEVHDHLCLIVVMPRTGLPMKLVRSWKDRRLSYVMLRSRSRSHHLCSSKWKAMLGHQGRRRFLPALFALFGAAPAALAAAAGFRNESDIPVLPAFLACAALGGVLSLIGRRHDTQSESETCTRRLSEAWDRLIRADCERLAQAVTDLAYGNLTSKLEIQSEPIRPADYAGAAELP